MEEIKNSAAWSLLELKEQSQRLESLASVSTVSLPENSRMHVNRGSKITTRGRHWWEYFNVSCSGGWKRDFFAFICGALVLSCLNFIVTGLFYNSNKNYRSVMEKEVNFLHESDVEFRELYETCMHNVTSMRTEMELIKEENNRLQTELATSTEHLNSQLSSLEYDQRRVHSEAQSMEAKCHKDMDFLDNDEFSLKRDIERLKAAQNESKTKFDLFLDQTNDTIEGMHMELDDLKRRTEDVNKQVGHNNKEIAQMEADLAIVMTNLTEVIESDCGGIISIPTTKESYLLQYKLNRTCDPNDNCLWTVENTQNSIRNQLTLKVELISHGFKGNTGLYAFKWNRNTSLVSEKITSGKEHELSAEGLYLSFSPDNDSSVVSTGFLLRITVIHSELKSHGWNLFFRTSQGSHRESGYHEADQISIVVNPGNRFTFNVDSVYSQKSNDYLTVYEIQPQGRFNGSNRMSGNLQGTKPLEIHTRDPVLTIFSTDDSTAFKGFNVSWASTHN